MIMVRYCLTIAIFLLFGAACGGPPQSTGTVSAKKSEQVPLPQPLETKRNTDTNTGVLNACPKFQKGEILGQVDPNDVNEASGLVVSRKNAEVIWVHNDSGGLPELFALKTDGSLVGTYAIAGGAAVDWEDVAADNTYLYIGDIGDNLLVRPHVVIYRVAEPEVKSEQLSDVINLRDVDKLELRYPDGAKDAETLMVDPKSGDLFIVTKERDNNLIFRAPAPHPWNEDQVLLELVVSDLPFTKNGEWEIYGGEVTGGDISPSGDAIIMRDYWHAYYWKRPPGTKIWEAFNQEACEVPVSLALVDGQGEAIGFDLDGKGYFTIPEFTIGIPKINIRYFARADSF